MWPPLDASRWHENSVPYTAERTWVAEPTLLPLQAAQLKCSTDAANFGNNPGNNGCPDSCKTFLNVSSAPVNYLEPSSRRACADDDTGN